ncbi:MAG: 1-deoxy-D-xylulose-5-phosphate synthase [Puniceicoccales bacterium]|jgi:1-deoxy-D-xylulose-5-phosphate synthase|nr:1-deoxy-D-xylulose-5-phosphate synthase [Puniceicoccales bacterium]
MNILDTIHTPRDVKVLSKGQLKELANEIRQILVDVTATNGGHLASNLGIVELTIALHRVFESPRDKLIFDVSHQTYVHKLLTGRNDAKFRQIRMSGGYSGFSDPTESEHDAFIAGHAGTALSVALGFAYARDHIGDHKDSCIVAILGDASLTCGMTMEALNNLTVTTKRLIVIVNDNKFSIDKNVGAISIHLNKILISGFYKAVTNAIKKMLGNGKFGKAVVRNVRKLKRAIKSIILPASYFEYYGLRYFGPIDGHDIAKLEEILEFCKFSNVPSLVHVKTVKGNGYVDAIHFPEKFHGVEPERAYNESFTLQPDTVSYGEVLGKELTKLAQKDKTIIGVVAAMARGTGLSYLRNHCPDQCIDVGIAEEHAVTFSAALAKCGMRPVCAIYSTFLQRAFDQVLHDVCLQNLPVIFCLDRAGIAVHDGVTHHGIFDLSYLRLIPNAVILQPKDIQEFVNALHSAFEWHRPVFLRYPKSYNRNMDLNALGFSQYLPLGKAEKITEGQKVCFLTLGNMIDLASEARKELENFGIQAGIVNMIFAKPMDGEILEDIAKNYEFVVTLEDNVLSGGFGSAVLEFYNDNGIKINILRHGWPDRFIKHGTSLDILRMEHGLSVTDITSKILSALNVCNS